MSELKGIYLASFQANHPNFNIVYQDINGKRDIPGDMLEIDLEPYDFIIATPPCNYYSRANYRRETSEYSQKTKHLLPGIINKLIQIDKPFIVENVINKNKMLFLLSFPGFYIEHGRHMYFTNVPFNPQSINQIDDMNNKPIMSGKYKGKLGSFSSKNQRQGGTNVHNVIEYWLSIVHEMYQPTLSTNLSFNQL
jgi:hypothetical protein